MAERMTEERFNWIRDYLAPLPGNVAPLTQECIDGIGALREDNAFLKNALALDADRIRSLEESARWCASCGLLMPNHSEDCYVVQIRAIVGDSVSLYASDALPSSLEKEEIPPAEDIAEWLKFVNGMILIAVMHIGQSESVPRLVAVSDWLKRLAQEKP